MSKYEVRCCCQPQKLLGWLDVYRPQRHFDDELIAFDALASPQEITSENEVDQFTMTEQIKLRFRLYAPIKKKAYWALSAEETPMEKLRKINGFVEAK